VQKIVPNLWFESETEEAVKYYTSIFKNSKILEVSHYTEAGPLPAGTVLTVDFELDGQRFTAINGGPVDFKFNESVSFLVNCDTQEEIDELWGKLGAGGQEIQCGWLKDKYGLAWQIVPTRMGELLADKDTEKVNRVMKAMLQMVKIDIDTLEKAYRGE
jgi:predicted 3-demethylubiquinone-9 3-methyltransferase (glyoxalase superfamily)